jgi:hypothetical protein
MRRILLPLSFTVLTAASAIAADPTAAATSAAPTAPTAPIAPQKLALIQSILAKLPMENIGVTMLQAPVADSVRQARALLAGRVSEEKQEAAMRDINADAKQFLDENVPLVRNNSKALISKTVAPVLAQRFSEDELRQLVALLESPVKTKFEAMVPELQQTLGQQISAASQDQINPKLAELKQRIGTRLHTAITPSP